MGTEAPPVAAWELITQQWGAEKGRQGKDERGLMEGSPDKDPL